MFRRAFGRRQRPKKGACMAATAKIFDFPIGFFFEFSISNAVDNSAVTYR